VGLKNSQAELLKQSDPDFIQQFTSEIQKNHSLQDQFCKDNYRNDIKQAFTCENCHTEKDAVIDWSKLGYSEDKVLKMTTLSTPNVFDKYDEFFIPSF